ncbi:uncharacterized protein J8A68_004073 [[Candida] subhashii]|uniref:3-deoxy-D-arabino-heptulosonate 7-phosphate synthase n=1 Tax=[Candida] subhashii TaxID=561895 RepID=A0A8J5QTJ3_9ASCO|nr:uncharacterized protein J8A68_004073 [[Candida] subhashii]KAG7662425.1 hypothetical protein J8A68_004073 [[Candida] subhashii]
MIHSQPISPNTIKKIDSPDSTMEITSTVNSILASTITTDSEESETLQESISSLTSGIKTGPKWDYSASLSNNSRQLSRSSSYNNSNITSGLCLNVKGHISIPQPEVIQNVLYPVSDLVQQKILHERSQIADLLNNDNSNKNPLLVIAGPKYIKDKNQIKACAQYLGMKTGKTFQSIPNEFLPEDIKSIYQDQSTLPNLLLSLRSNLTKYNHEYGSTTSNPSSIMTYEIAQGIPQCRSLLCELAEQVPLVAEISDTLTPQYLSDLFTMGLVGPTLMECQLHRELASGLSCSVGFNPGFDEDMFDHKLTSALDSIYATSQPHQFLSITKSGTVAVVGTTGNQDTFVILPINEKITLDEIVKFIAQINGYKNLKNKIVKIVLDIERVSNSDYEYKLSLLKQLFKNQDISQQIVGVMIDTGDHYVPNDLEVDLTPGDEQDEDEEWVNLLDEDSYTTENERKLVELTKKLLHKKSLRSIRSKNSTTDSLTSFQPNSSYDYFINANKILIELNNLRN